MNTHIDFLKLLLPPVAYDKAAQFLSTELSAEANQLDAFQASVMAMLLEIDPRTTVQLLSDWERVYGLPDQGLMTATTIAERQARLTAKVLQTGGLSKAYFQSLLEQAGYTVIIDEPRGFFAGVNRCGDRIYSPPAVCWYWRVRLRRNGQVISAANRSQVRAWLDNFKAAFSFVDLED
ncbi:putative phage tail protein [Undibacterium sp. Ren11W]|uniref:putative phage tail protein n=1 Tax=Undibacterium sp. Ren11W TaxID=3413045 RepID=UPI003BF44D72